MVKTRIFTKPSEIFAPKGITHQKLLKLMKIILPNKHIIKGYPKRFLTISICKSKMQIQKSTKCNTTMQTKRNLKLYALTCMQINNQNRKHRKYPSPLLR